MSEYRVRNLRSDDFAAIMEMEATVFADTSEGVLGPYYVRLCCDFYPESSFLVETGDEENPVTVGYLLSFPRGREVYCTTLAVHPDYQGTRAILTLLQGFCRWVIPYADSVWFTVESGNFAARSLHRLLGAEEVEVREDFYGPGRSRIISRIEREGFDRMRSRYQRLGLLPPDFKDSTEEAAG